MNDAGPRYDPRMASDPVVSIRNVSKTYASGFEALKRVDLDIRRGEIFALLGPNGAGKTTLISIICGIVNASSGTVVADGHDIVADYRGARSKIGLVPQELSTDTFETVWATLKFSRGLFGKPPESVMILASFLSHSDNSRSTFSRCTGSGGLPNRPRLNFNVDQTVSNVSVDNSCGTRPILLRAPR